MRALELRGCTAEAPWKGPAPDAPATSDGGGGSHARPPDPEPRSTSTPSPPPRARSPGPHPGLGPPGRSSRPPRRDAPLRRPRVPLTGPAWASRLRCPPPHARPDRAPAEQRRQLERGVPHLLGKVGGGEGAPLVQRVGQKPALGRRSNSPASRHLVSTVAAATDRRPRQEEGGDVACS